MDFSIINALAKIKYKCVVFLTLAFIFLGSGVSTGAVIAVFPFLDLTSDTNGVNFEITEIIRGKLIESGYEVLPDDEIMDFMVRHRIRSLETLSLYQLYLFKTETKADFALFGTVCQNVDMPSGRISLSLKLVRTSDEKIIWTKTSDLHTNDMISLLGLADPESLDDLYLEFFSDILESFPLSPDPVGELKPVVYMLNAEVLPRYVRPGEKIEVKVKQLSYGGDGNTPSFYFLVDGRKHDAVIAEDDSLVATSFLAAEKDGSYPIELVAEFAGGEITVLNIGKYTVDSIPPELTLHLVGLDIDGEISFSSELVLLPELKIPERIEQWEMKVYSPEGDTYVHMFAQGQVPGRFIWDGKGDTIERVPDNKYKISITVWDRAMNKAEAEGFASYRHLEPEIVFYLDQKEDSFLLEFESQLDYKIKFWLAKIYQTSGKLVSSWIGDDLPPSVEFKAPELEEGDDLELVFAAQDVYGNRTYVQVPNFFNLPDKEQIEEVVPESQWLENF